MSDLENDPELCEYLKRSQPPKFEDIVAFAKARDIKGVPEFWEFFDRIWKLYRQKKTYEGDWT